MRGCDLGYYSACLLAAKAEMLTPKHSVRSERPDPAKAPPLLQKACLKGDVIEACENYADMHFRGFEDVVKVRIRSIKF